MYVYSHKKKNWLALDGGIISVIFTFHSVLSLCIFQVFYNQIRIVSVIRKRTILQVKHIDIYGECKTSVVFLNAPPKI